MQIDGSDLLLFFLDLKESDIIVKRCGAMFDLHIRMPPTINEYKLSMSEINNPCNLNDIPHKFDDDITSSISHIWNNINKVTVYPKNNTSLNLQLFDLYNVKNICVDLYDYDYHKGYILSNIKIGYLVDELFIIGTKDMNFYPNKDLSSYKYLTMLNIINFNNVYLRDYSKEILTTLPLNKLCIDNVNHIDDSLTGSLKYVTKLLSLKIKNTPLSQSTIDEMLIMTNLMYLSFIRCGIVELDLTKWSLNDFVSVDLSYNKISEIKMYSSIKCSSLVFKVDSNDSNAVIDKLLSTNFTLYLVTNSMYAYVLNRGVNAPHYVSKIYDDVDYKCKCADIDFCIKNNCIICYNKRRTIWS